jgi:hypothetical protein
MTKEERDKWFERPSAYLFESPKFAREFLEQMQLNHPDAFVEKGAKDNGKEKQ